LTDTLVKERILQEKELKAAEKRKRTETEEKTSL
jgi:hypothetical protein